ncbi:MAG: hypothetical protein WC477_01910 [Patescibacteria group bacterium]
MTLSHVLIGLLVLAMGVGLIWKTRAIVGFFGHMDWADQKLGGGGTYLVYKTVGVLLCFFGMLYATNLWDAFIAATFGSLFPH